jgi:hypothetical protein
MDPFSQAVCRSSAASSIATVPLKAGRPRALTVSPAWATIPSEPALLKEGPAVMTVPEVLVVGYAPPENIPGWPVLAQVPPLLTVLRARLEDLPEIARHARLAIGRRPDGTAERVGDETVLEELDDAARLFLSGWLEYPVEKSERPGEGLPWDAPGFEPPGPPTSD